MCVNYSHDLITEYGDKLIATHLNDNMKMTGDEITWCRITIEMRQKQ